MRKIAFGLDLAGYSTKKSVLAAIVDDNRKRTCYILTSCPFSKKTQSNSSLDEVARSEGQALTQIAILGKIAIDVPIDLQQIDQRLKNPLSAEHVWELYLRPVDRALGALPALADRIGSPVLRFKAMFKMAPKLVIGEHIFETYPKASLELMKKGSSIGYKGAKEAQRNACRKLSQELNVRSTALKQELSEHELDAILCALTAAASPTNQLNGSRLKQKIASKLDGGTDCTPPKGYILLHRAPSKTISIKWKKFEDWMQEHTSA